MENSGHEAEQERLPIVSVRFSPNDLPAGSIDMEDFAQFLDGINLALDGLVQYELSAGLLTETNLHPRLTISAIRSGSIECDIAINLSGNAPVILGIAGVAAFVAKEVASELIKDGLEGVGKGARTKVVEVVSRFMSSLNRATAPHARGSQASDLPPDLTLNMLAGLRKMARVGAKRSYGEEGVTVSADVRPFEMATFNAGAQRNVEQLAREALASQEHIELEGSIEDPSTRKHRFVLDRPGQSKGNRYITCLYGKQFEDKVRSLYAQRAYVRVQGLKMYRVQSHRAKPLVTVHVTSITESEPIGLWTPNNRASGE